MIIIEKIQEAITAGIKRIFRDVVKNAWVALMTIPSGICGSYFTGYFRDKEISENNDINAARIEKTFVRPQCRYSRNRTVLPYQTMEYIQSYVQISEEDIFAAVAKNPRLAVRSINSTKPAEQRGTDELAVELFPAINRSYGTFIDRGSDVTIVATSCYTELGLAAFSYSVALYGGFNYVAKTIVPENEMLSSVNGYKGQSFFLLPEKKEDWKDFPNMLDFLKDIDNLNKRILKRGGNPYVISLLSADGGDEPSRPTHFHHVIGGEKDLTDYSDPDITIKDTLTFAAYYKELELLLPEGIGCDIQKYHIKPKPNNLQRQFKDAEAFTIRIAWDITLRSSERTVIIASLADVIHKYFDPNGKVASDEIRKQKGIGYEWCE